MLLFKKKNDSPVALLMLGHDINLLFNIFIDSHIVASNLNMYWLFVAQVTRQLAHLFRPGGCKHHCLTVWTNLSTDFSDLRFEAHVKHTIGLI